MATGFPCRFSDSAKAAWEPRGVADTRGKNATGTCSEGRRALITTSASEFRIGVLTHHWAKEETLAEARGLLDGNGMAQSKAPGFVSRRTLYSLAEPNKITTLVVWESNQIYDAWRSSPERAVAMAGANELWARPPESERFELAG